MQNIFQKFMTRYNKYKPFFNLIIFIIALEFLPNIIVFALSAIVSYKLTEKRKQRNILIVFFSLLAFISLCFLLLENAPKTEVVNIQKIEQNIDSVSKAELPFTVLASSTDHVEEKNIDLAGQESVKKEVVDTDNKSIPFLAESYEDVADVEESADESKSLSDDPKDESPSQKLYEVIKVVDGDTLDVSIEGKIERLRLIGINTPETVDPRKPVECFGIEASNKAKALLVGKKISLQSDSSQGELDKYNRLLRYVHLSDGTNFNLLMISGGYAYEYTYDVPYKYQSEFKKAQKEAMDSKAGLWGDVCQNKTENTTGEDTASTPTNTSGNSCDIKGNINASGEKIYHMIGCGSYGKTVIDLDKGEKWFCSEQEALDIGWRKALNC